MKEKERRADGVYVGGKPAVVAPDGYVRRSPVQPVTEAPDYRKRMIRRAVGTVIGLAIAAVVIVVLIDKLI